MSLTLNIQFAAEGFHQMFSKTWKYIFTQLVILICILTTSSQQENNIGIMARQDVNSLQAESINSLTSSEMHKDLGRDKATAGDPSGWKGYSIAYNVTLNNKN